MLRVRKALDARDMPYQLRYIGQPDLGDKNRPTVVRSSLDIACSGMLIEFLNELGCRVDFEYSVKGLLNLFIIIISVYLLYYKYGVFIIIIMLQI